MFYKDIENVPQLSINIFNNILGAADLLNDGESLEDSISALKRSGVDLYEVIKIST